MRSILTDTKHFLVLTSNSSESIKELILDVPAENYATVSGFPANPAELNKITNDQDARTFSAVSLLRKMLQENPSFLDVIQKSISQQLLAFLLSPDFLIETAKWLPCARELPEEWMSALDSTDEALEREDEWVIAVYAGVEYLAECGANFESLMRSLLHFWMIQNQRWMRIKAKILIPEHLYCPELAAFQDGAKLSSYILKL